jgi:hypothetical protein
LPFSAAKHVNRTFEDTVLFKNQAGNFTGGKTFFLNSFYLPPTFKMVMRMLTMAYLTRKWQTSNISEQNQNQN